ncbi:MAG: AmmeMemoRadiSam system protein A [Acidobacteria bacterium]|nr:AmmeMemoRadiSam system protein A [Acidobacteriota bacterium]MCI0622887.1 AmmeMemoRadiSam system protein A [Acidobacteriota bacterium]MCI0720712.1 AmmeMemoRadiSam system protein A [Acidobacteriota bacterium]
MFQLSESAQSELLKLSRLCLEEFLQQGRKTINRAVSPELLESRGVFVTLDAHGELRGCIGVPLPVSPLYQATQKCALSAATADPRFPPLVAAELRDVQIEISVLSPLEAVEEIEAIEIGVHGLLVQHLGRRGLLLPQVAVEQGWDRLQFLEQVCRKAHLPSTAWKEGAQIERFSAFVFREERSGSSKD